MYSGVGLPTARGTGTSGYVIKNLSHLKRDKSKCYEYPSDKRPEYVRRRISEEVLEHNLKREIEIRVLEHSIDLENSEKYSSSEIENKTKEYRKLLFEEYNREKKRKEYEEKHELDIKERENRRFREALGISPDAQEGDAFRFGEITKRKELQNIDMAESKKRKDSECIRQKKEKDIVVKNDEDPVRNAIKEVGISDICDEYLDIDEIRL